ncbi:MAG: glycosyltransferase family 2 protein [Acidimicrobiia bacterium]
MIRALLWLVQLLFVAPAVYSTVVSLWGLRSPAAQTRSSSVRRMRILVPAHDEANVIEGIASDLASQDFDANQCRSVVIADRCADDTAARARKHVEVVERSSGEGAKGAAIAWYLTAEPLEPGESVVILDADNRIGHDFVSSIASAMDDGHHVVQTYLDVANPDGSALATASALTYWASNRMVQLARTNLGWSCDLGGTGMAFTAEALDDAGGVTDDLTDDLALNVRLNLAGHKTHWLHDVKVRDEKPTETGATVTQRARWVRGKRSVQRAYGRELIGTGLRDRRMDLLDLAFRLYNPGRSFIALMIAVLALVAAVFPEAGLWPWWILAGIAAIVVLLPMVFLVVDEVPGKYVARYPYVALIAMLWLPIRVASRLMPNWKRTAHSGS